MSETYSRFIPARSHKIRLTPLFSVAAACSSMFSFLQPPYHPRRAAQRPPTCPSVLSPPLSCLVGIVVCLFHYSIIFEVIPCVVVVLSRFRYHLYIYASPSTFHSFLTLAFLSALTIAVVSSSFFICLFV